MVLIVGDVMLDRFVFGTVDRINPEAPVPILEVSEVSHNLGGAGNVAMNLITLHEEVTLVGIVGDDDDGKLVQTLCERVGINFIPLAKDRITTLKERYVALPYRQQLLRVDRELRLPVEDKYWDATFSKIKGLQPEYIIVSDYAKGVITPYGMRKLRTLDVPLFVDPKPQNIELYRDSFLVKPNLRELRIILNRPVANDDHAVEEAGRMLYDRLRANLVITRSEKGATLISKDGIVHVPAERREVYDVTGAGDTFIAALVWGYKRTGNLIEAVRLANKAAGIAVSKLGVATVTVDEVLG